MGAILKTAVDSINGVPAQAKAAIIAAACGVFGVICGFVLYVVFTHMFEHGDVAAKAAGVFVGLVVSMAVAWTAERLWETIDTGEFKLGGHTRRAFVAGLSLVIVFELSASAFEDFARELTGNFDGIKHIAAGIAGRDSAQADAALDEHQALALLSRLSAAATHLRLEGSGHDTSPDARVLSLLTTRERLELFARELQPSDDDIRNAFFSAFSTSLGVVSGVGGKSGCVRSLPLYPSPSLSLETALTASAASLRIAECRSYLLALDESARALKLSRAMQRVTARYDLYDTDSFSDVLRDEENGLAPVSIAKLASQRKECDAIRDSSPNAKHMLCDEAARRGVAVAGSGTLLPPLDIKALNRDLLAAAFPGAVEPLPILWWDMGLMFLMWCTSAVVVGVYLSYLTFSELADHSLKAFGIRMFIAFCALWVAGLIAAAVIAVVRVVPFLWLLMTDPGSTSSHAVPGMFNLIPGMVRWLASGDTGVVIPAWFTLPALFLATLMVAIRSTGSSQDSGLSTISGMMLLGIVLSAVAPVLDGLVGVVLLLVGAWFVPTFGLAILAPYLTPGRELPHWWGIVSLLGGLAVAFWVAVIQPDLVTANRGIVALAGLVAAGTGALILRRVPMTDLWPLLAMTIGLLLLGLSAAFQQLTFAGVLKELHPVAHSEAPMSRTVALQTNEDVIGYLTVLTPRNNDEDIPEAFRAKDARDDVSVSLNLELALSGSIGFWLTLSLMVGSALKQGPRRSDESPTPPRDLAADAKASSG